MKIPRSFLGLFLVFAVTAQADPKAFELDDHTVALWNFSEGQDTVYRDEGPGGFDVKSSQAEGYEPPAKVEGKFGEALSFTGSSRLEMVASRPPMAIQDAITVEAWIKIPAQEEKQGMGILQYGKAAAEGFRFAVETTGELAWLVPADGREVMVRTRVKLPLDEWIHVAGTYDGQTMKVFVNGELDNERDVSNANLGGKSDLVIGYFSGGGRPPFTGEINGIRVSNVARENFPSR